MLERPRRCTRRTPLNIANNDFEIDKELDWNFLSFIFLFFCSPGQGIKQEIHGIRGNEFFKSLTDIRVYPLRTPICPAFCYAFNYYLFTRYFIIIIIIIIIITEEFSLVWHILIIIIIVTVTITITITITIKLCKQILKQTEITIYDLLLFIQT